MDSLTPLPLAVSLLGAAGLTALRGVLGRRVFELAAVAVSAAVALLLAALLAASIEAPIVYWFGDWTPVDGVALGISFVIEPLGAALATLAAVLVTASFVFTWRFFDNAEHLFHVLMLVFLAGMVGFALTGDLFTLFVFFELMSVSAFSLAGYKTEEEGSLQGALNFAVTNSIGAFLILAGIGLLYGRTGALNLAQLGEALAGAPPDGLVITSFVFLVTGYLVKAAAVPFHFWLADAYATAPTSVCVLFAGVLSELGLYAVARVYWTVFDGAFAGHLPALRAIVIGLGTLTALVGAAMCFPQRHIKRLLAFATVSHVGLLLIGVGIFTPTALAGTLIYIVTDGLVKASLFFCTGILLHRLASVDELGCDGLGAVMPLTRVLFVLGGLGLAGLFPFGTYLGKSLIEDEAAVLGYPWVTWVFIAASVVTAGAVLRVAARVFWGVGPGDAYDIKSEAEGDEVQPEGSRGGSGSTPASMWATAALLIAAAFVSGLIPQLAGRVEVAAEHFVDRRAYADLVLAGVPPPEVGLPPAESSFKGALIGLASAVAAGMIAAAGLWHMRLPRTITRGATALLGPPFARLRALHSGHVGDYVAWLTVGVAVLGGLMAVMMG